MSFFDNLISAWTFENSGNMGADSYGGNNLTNNNSVTQVSALYGHGASFNGTNQSLSIASNASLNLDSTAWELTAWVNPHVLPTTGVYPTIIGKWGAAGQDYLILLNGDFSGRIQGAATSGGTGATESDVFGSGSEAIDSWYFVDMWYDLTNLHLLINNTAVTQGSTALSSTHAGTSNFTMGVSAFGSPFFSGKIGPTNLWKRNLQGTERTALFNGLLFPFNVGGRRRHSVSNIR